jgi:hypothetical protein
VQRGQPPSSTANHAWGMMRGGPGPQMLPR